MTGPFPSNVSDPAGDGAGVTRRNVMNMMTALATVPAVGLPSGALAVVATNRGEWDAALAIFRRVNETSERLFAAHSAAEEAWDKVCPREDRFFDEFKLGMGMNRERALSEIRYQLCQREGLTGLVVSPPKKRIAFEAKLDAVGKEAERIADEFMAYQKHHAETKLANRVDELWDRASAHDDRHYFPARDALMSLPAPDQEGLLVKMEISAISLENDHVESTLADARRLLGGRAA